MEIDLNLSVTEIKNEIESRIRRTMYVLSFARGIKEKSNVMHVIIISLSLLLGLMDKSLSFPIFGIVFCISSRLSYSRMNNRRKSYLKNLEYWLDVMERSVFTEPVELIKRAAARATEEAKKVYDTDEPGTEQIIKAAYLLAKAGKIPDYWARQVDFFLRYGEGKFIVIKESSVIKVLGPEHGSANKGAE